MNLFVQGMRRSGTTILYDALCEDPELRCFYEPLREEKETVGGGSGARETDVFAETRALRRAFQQDRYPQVTIEEFNWGGPRRPELELEPELPPHCRDLLRHLLDLAPQVAIKETRLYCKVAALAELDPDAAFVHVVRDPRAVASSIVLNRGRRRLPKLGGPDGFFADRKPRKLWSSRGISERVLAEHEGELPTDPSNVERVLLVWELSFARAREEGLRRFGDRYLLLTNEFLRAEPEQALEKVHRLLGRSLPSPVADWARTHVRSSEEPYAADDPRWREAFARLGIEDAVAEAGYGHLVGRRGDDLVSVG